MSRVDGSVITTAWRRRQAVQINRLHRNGSLARHSALVESTASRCCESDKTTPISVAARSWQTVYDRQAPTFRRNSSTRAHGVTYKKPVILNTFTSSNYVCQAQSTPPDSFAKRQADKTQVDASLRSTHATPTTAYKQKLQNSIFDVMHQNQPI